ncbi:MAG TPA: hypothetical protein VEA40_02145 [Ramlibacter sp.]|nr:hypothetical protein [Ramlibacter sp.]
MTRAFDDVGSRWLAAMRAGDWEAAWQQTDRIEAARRRAQREPGFERGPGQLVWDGSDLRGRSVLVRCEHGLGDTLQFSRFFPWLCAQASELHVMAQPQLLPLLRGVPGFGQVHDGWAGPDWPAHELEIEVMELAYASRATPATVPPPAAGLRARLTPGLPGAPPADGRLRAGLLWAASGWDTSRSIPAPELAPLLDLAGVQWFALQQGDAASDPALQGAPLEPLWRHTGGVWAAARAMLALDLVVCVDGMPAHLAGSLGCPTWLLLKHDADWRWGASGERTPWYASMRLFRQPAAGEWRSVIARIAGELDRLASPTRRSGAR